MDDDKPRLAVPPGQPHDSPPHLRSLRRVRRQPERKTGLGPRGGSTLHVMIIKGTYTHYTPRHDGEIDVSFECTSLL